jgi:hypothetical protein
MSDRQLARAATSGRRLTVLLHTGDSIRGYLVGSDDFHWLVAHLDPTCGPQVTLVHKGSAPRIDISPSPTLSGEDQDYQAFVKQIGAGFWSFCTETFLPTNPAAALENAS